MSNTQPLRPWRTLSDEEQLALRQDYQVELDKQTGTCSLDEKTERFTNWLAERDVSFSMDDVRRPKR